MVRKIKLQRILNEYIPKLRKHNVFNGFNLDNYTRYSFYPIISVSFNEEKVYADKTQFENDFGDSHIEIIKQLMKHYDIENYEIEIW